MLAHWNVDGVDGDPIVAVRLVEENKPNAKPRLYGKMTTPEAPTKTVIAKSVMKDFRVRMFPTALSATMSRIKVDALSAYDALEHVAKLYKLTVAQVDAYIVDEIEYDAHRVPSFVCRMERRKSKILNATGTPASVSPSPNNIVSSIVTTTNRDWGTNKHRTPIAEVVDLFSKETKVKPSKYIIVKTG